MRFVVPVFDDTTLMFGSRIKGQLESRGHYVAIALLANHRLSERQLDIHLSAAPDLVVAEDYFGSDEITPFDGVVACKVPVAIRRILKTKFHKRSTSRPCFVAFQPGLEFTPERGRRNRIDFDAVFLYSLEHRDQYNAHVKDRPSQHVSFGHPYFIREVSADHSSRNSGENIYFFAQAISPSTFGGRQFIADVLSTLAQRYPDKKVVIKLRHLPSENNDHVHRESYDYISIIENHLDERPSNLIVSDCSMSEALADACLALTCTSTAVMDALTARVPAMIYLDYVEGYLDPLNGAMRREFQNSGLIANLDQVMALRHLQPNDEWLKQHFRGDDLFEEVETVVQNFKGQSR
jgi:hypothetical protein